MKKFFDLFDFTSFFGLDLFDFSGPPCCVLFQNSYFTNSEPAPMAGWWYPAAAPKAKAINLGSYYLAKTRQLLTAERGAAFKPLRLFLK